LGHRTSKKHIPFADSQNIQKASNRRDVLGGSFVSVRPANESNWNLLMFNDDVANTVAMGK